MDGYDLALLFCACKLVYKFLSLTHLVLKPLCLSIGYKTKSMLS
jgi:hypothetical protein